MKFIVCAALAVMTGAAGATINKCVDQDGHVLYTDADCPVATQPITAQEPAQDPMETPAVAPSPVTMISPAPRSRWADLPRPLIRKTVSVDASTLLAARQNMLMQDELHKSRRLLSSR